MTRKEFISLVFTMLILLLSMLTGYVLLALVYEGNPLLVALIGFIVLAVACILVVYLFKLRKMVGSDEKSLGKQNEDKENENKIKK